MTLIEAIYAAAEKAEATGEAITIHREGLNVLTDVIVDRFSDWINVMFDKDFPVTIASGSASDWKIEEPSGYEHGNGLKEV